MHCCHCVGELGHRLRSQDILLVSQTKAAVSIVAPHEDASRTQNVQYLTVGIELGRALPVLVHCDCVLRPTGNFFDFMVREAFDEDCVASTPSTCIWIKTLTRLCLVIECGLASRHDSLARLTIP